MRARALHTVRQAMVSSPKDRVRLDFIALALRGKKIGFEKVIAMVDEMVVTLKAEQAEDDEKKEYCAKELDLADDKKRGLERTVSDLETAIENAQEDIAKLGEEIKVLTAGIKELDKKVGEATEQRKKENEDFKELKASDTAAKEIMAFAKERLNKFYNPKMVKASLAQESAAPPPPPESFDAYSKKSGDSMGVIAMIDKLVMDLEKEMVEAETEEKNSQADYETCMRDSAEKRTKDSKLLSEKEGTKAELETDLETNTDDKAAATKELMSTMGYISQLHNECDFLIKYFDVRKEARTSEIDALGKARDVLNGADYSFLQVRSRRWLP
jgi:septal ring factor EnvC (AmiA/AmiB activator)